MPVDDPRQELQRLKALQETGLLTARAPPEFQDMCGRAHTQFRTTMVLVKVVTEDKIIVKAQIGTDIQEMPRHDAFSNHTIRSDDVFVVHDAAKDERFASHLLVTQYAIVFYAGAPLIYRREVRLGSFCLLDTKPREFSLGDRAELALMADELVSVLIRQDMDRSWRLH